MIQEQANRARDWDGNVTGNASDYQPVCSKTLPNISYEVVDTGTFLLGDVWCKWLARTYGAANTSIAADIFGIVSLSRQTEVAQQQRAAVTSQAIGRVQQQIGQATQDARQLAYASACQQHNGYVENGFCLVDYPGSPKWRVAINYAGLWNNIEADVNRRTCELASQQASAAEKDGHAWAAAPIYHSDTGVCIQSHQ